MKALKMIVVGWLLLVVIAIAAVVAGAQPGASTDTRARDDVVSDLNQADMLESDQQMLEQMRARITPGMDTMIENEPMWVDPEMIRLQEEYQAQLDRMIAKRPGTP